ncbi:hypothetical protein GQS_08000 [Thermococcus sp. 4557]|uniref:hypothetical protein n=1 Tax=Thermococcus sp. (strain CGMCC 1.5172 / 4557) TaxID=1042877 RepID=UPI000219ED1C|nr:hypothetical protein [Thermococcus sp. 4557]AEK73496.1 hypothetical protein GQS_08000 [Thermococcus sp. 4557]
MNYRHIFISFLFLLLLTPPIYSLPYWFKEGTYVRYALLMPKNNDEHEWNAFQVWPGLLPKDAYKNISTVEKIDNGSFITLVVKGNVFLTFEIVDISDDTASIRVTLDMSKVLVNFHKPLNRLILSRTIHLNLTDMMYYQNGRALGMPAFFMDPAKLPDKGALLVRLSILRESNFRTSDLRVNNVSFTWMDKKILHTYYGDFNPPYILVESNEVPLIWSREGGGIWVSVASSRVYDSDTGVMLTAPLMGLSPELLTIGIINGDSYDYLAGRRMKELFDEGKADREWWEPGFNLYDTNIKFPETSSSKTPITGMKYFFAASLALLVITAVLNWRWKRE